MHVRTAVSTDPSIAAAAAEIHREIGEGARVLLYFASSKIDAPAFARALQAELPSTLVAGCSTAGEIVSGKMLKGSVVAMALDGGAGFDAAMVPVPRLGDPAVLDAAFAELERHFGEPVRSMDHRRYVGIVLTDGLSGAEEWLMEQLGDRTDVAFVGGSAGDDLAFAKTFVAARGEAFSGGAVLLLLRPDAPFTTVKTQSFRVLDRRLLATKVDEATRTVIEFDHKPAAVAYAEALGTTVADLPNHFMAHPLGLMTGLQPFVRSPARVAGESIVFFCNVLEGMELAVLESGDIVAETRAALAAASDRVGGAAGVINFHCILRTLELEAKQATKAYGEVFAEVPTVGFSTYGEAYLGHMNQTSTMLVFAKAA